MTPIDVGSALAAEHVRDLRAAAARDRLRALARCCEPAAWLRAATRLRSVPAATAAWFRRGQLGPTANYCATC